MKGGLVNKGDAGADRILSKRLIIGSGATVSFSKNSDFAALVRTFNVE